MRIGRGLATLLLAAVAAAHARAQSPPMQAEFQVSETSDYYQYPYGVAIDNTGRFVVCWSSYNSADQNYDVLGRLYDPAGQPVAGEFEIDASTANQYGGDVAKDASGRFVVVWQDSDTSLRARRFERDGTPLGASIPVNAVSYPVSDSHVAAAPAGNFVVAWTRLDPASSFDVVARRFDNNGVPIGNEFVVNTYTTDGQRARGLAVSRDAFAIAWGGDGTVGPGVWARPYNAHSGAPLTEDLKVNQGLLVFNPPEADVAMSATGDFVVAWDGFVSPTDLGVFVRRYDAAGVPLSDDVMVNANYSTGAQGSSRVASDAAGNFLVSWTGRPSDGDASGVLGHFFDRFGTSVSEDFLVNSTTTGYQYGSQVALNDAGAFVVAWSSPDQDYYGSFARRGAVHVAAPITVGEVTLGNLSSVIEPGESVSVETAWVNQGVSEVSIVGAATDFSGPPGATYTLDDATAEYPPTLPGDTGPCNGTGDCYEVTVSDPAVRPLQHWDALLQEATSIGLPHTWVLHIGRSFPDVPTDNIFYTFIENLFHNGVTGGCAGGGYCPGNPVTRAQMAVFLLKAKYGAAHVPPPCTAPVFIDVPCALGPFDAWIAELAGLGITGGCGGGFYCPNSPVTRQQMAVFLLKTLEGSTYLPPACTGIFDDVPCTPGTGFSDWIEELYDRGITGGCSATPLLYCPTNPNNRGQMAVFLVKTFGLVLYGG